MRRAARPALALAAPAVACVISGCDHDRLGAFGKPLDVLAPVALDRSVGFVDRSSRTAVVVDASDPDLRGRRFPVGPDPMLAQRRVLKDELLILSRGERGSPGVDPEDAGLTVASTDPGTEARRFVLGSRFNALAQTPDGEMAIAHFAAGADKGGVLFNPNEIAIVQLDQPAAEGTNPRHRTVRSFGGVPNQIVFSPPMKLPDGPRRLAVVLSDTYVTLVDLDHLDRSEITIPLTLPEDSRLIRPRQVVFDIDEPALYVRSEASDDVYAMRLVPIPPAERISNDYRPSLSQLGAGKGPADMALFDAAQGRRLLVVSPGSKDASVVDARTSRVTRIPLDAVANRIVLFQAAAPGDPAVRQRALLLGPGAGPLAAAFLDLDDVEQKLGRNVDPRPMSAPVSAILPRADTNVVIALHEAGGGAPGISVIDLARRTTAPILAEVPLARSSWGLGADRLWVAPDKSDRLGFLELGTFQPGEVRLDAEIDLVLPLLAGREVAVLHGAFGGWLTVLDAADPRRETGRSVRGFLISGLLERKDDR